MAYLLDTCTFLWALSGADHLSLPVTTILRDEVEIYVSSISAWEISVKYARGTLGLSSPPRLWWHNELNRLNLLRLPLEDEAALYVSALPEIHKDPFDRMLICQALYHNLTILTPDAFIRQYPVRVIW